jgi:hypothetical protein
VTVEDIRTATEPRVVLDGEPEPMFIPAAAG